MKQKQPHEGGGNRLRVLRAERRVSQAEVGAAIGYCGPYISLIENGRHTPPPTVVAKLSEFFGVKPSKIFPKKAAA